MTRQEIRPSTAATELRLTRMLFFAITGFVVFCLFAALVIVQYLEPLQLPEINIDLFTWIMAALSIFILLLAKMVFNKGVKAAKNSLITLIDKLRQYRRALLVYLALCEAAAMLNIVLFVVAGDFLFLAFAAVLLGFMMAMNPSLRRVAAELEVDALQLKELS